MRFEGFGLLEPARRRNVSMFNNMETGKSIFRINENLHGIDTATYDVILIQLLDLAFVSNDLHVLSVEQQRLTEKYCKEADTIKTKELSKFMKELDIFLGSYGL